MSNQSNCLCCDIVIVTFNSENFIEACLHSIIEAEEYIVNKIVVVDNNSTDSTLNILNKCETRIKNLEIIQNKSNRGYSVANNQGLELCSSKYVVFLNPDSRINHFSITHLINSIEDIDDAYIAGPKIISNKGRVRISFGSEPTVLSLIGEFLNGRRILSLVQNKNRMKKNPSQVDWVSGTCLLASRSCIHDLGGFDENYFMYSEDVDLCLRAKQHGWNTIYVPESVVTHIGGMSRESNLKGALVANFNSRLYFAYKFWGRTRCIIVRLLLIIIALGRMLVHFGLSWKNERDWELTKGFAITLWSMLRG